MGDHYLGSPGFLTLNRSRSNSTDFPRFDLHRSRLIPRESDILKMENYNKRSVYLLPKSCGQPLGESWPRAIRSGRGRVGM
jgi:hypothetical protein